MYHGSEIPYFDTLATAKKSYGKRMEPVCGAYALTRNELDVVLFLAEPLADIIAAAVTTFMFFRFFLKMLKERLPDSNES